MCGCKERAAEQRRSEQAERNSCIPGSIFARSLSERTCYMRELELRGQKACVAPLSLEVRSASLVLCLKHLHGRSGDLAKIETEWVQSSRPFSQRFPNREPLFYAGCTALVILTVYFHVKWPLKAQAGKHSTLHAKTSKFSARVRVPGSRWDHRRCIEERSVHWQLARPLMTAMALWRGGAIGAEAVPEARATLSTALLTCRGSA